MTTDNCRLALRILAGLHEMGLFESDRKLVPEEVLRADDGGEIDALRHWAIDTLAEALCPADVPTPSHV